MLLQKLRETEKDREKAISSFKSTQKTYTKKYIKCCMVARDIYGFFKYLTPLYTLFCECEYATERETDLREEKIERNIKHFIIFPISLIRITTVVCLWPFLLVDYYTHNDPLLLLPTYFPIYCFLFSSKKSLVILLFKMRHTHIVTHSASFIHFSIFFLQEEKPHSRVLSPSSLSSAQHAQTKNTRRCVEIIFIMNGVPSSKMGENV